MMKKIYIAAPLFNEMELKRNEEINMMYIFRKKKGDLHQTLLMNQINYK